MRHETMTCETFGELLGAMLEGDLDPSQAGAVEAHAAGCATCAALRADLLRISAEASALPVLAPSRDLWQGIAGRIEPKVLPLAAPAAPSVQRRQWMRPSLMAAGLVFLTAGVTWFATNYMNERGAARQVAAGVETDARDSAAPAIAGESAMVASGPRSGGTRPSAPSPTSEMFEQPEMVVAASDPQRPTGTVRPTGERVSGGGRPASQPAPTGERRASGTAMLASETVPAAARVVEEVYGSEIQRLHDIMAQRKSELDPATVKVIEDNLAIIDSAIVQSRRAIARDPNSGFLMEQLNSVLDRKVGLLRTAAMLPARS